MFRRPQKTPGSRVTSNPISVVRLSSFGDADFCDFFEQNVCVAAGLGALMQNLFTSATKPKNPGPIGVNRKLRFKFALGGVAFFVQGPISVRV